MPSLTWTRERPREDGRYWLRVGAEKSIVRILSSRRPPDWCIQYEGGHVGYLQQLLDGFTCEWAGPIPQPEEPRGWDG